MYIYIYIHIYIYIYIYTVGPACPDPVQKLPTFTGPEKGNRKRGSNHEIT